MAGKASQTIRLRKKTNRRDRSNERNCATSKQRTNITDRRDQRDSRAEPTRK